MSNVIPVQGFCDFCGVRDLLNPANSEDWGCSVCRFREDSPEEFDRRGLPHHRGVPGWEAIHGAPIIKFSTRRVDERGANVWRHWEDGVEVRINKNAKPAYLSGLTGVVVGREPSNIVIRLFPRQPNVDHRWHSNRYVRGAGDGHRYVRVNQHALTEVTRKARGGL